MARRKKQQTTRKLRAIYKAPGKPAQIIEVEDTLPALQATVGGSIEVASLTTENVVVCNRDGRRLGLAVNALGIAGPLIILGKGDGESFGDAYRAEDILAMLHGDWVPRG